MTVLLVGQFFGALAILLPFVLLQFGKLSKTAYTYLALNLVGAAALTIDAYFERQWGFVALQAAWALIAAWGIGWRARRTTTPTSSTQ